MLIVRQTSSTLLFHEQYPQYTSILLIKKPLKILKPHPLSPSPPRRTCFFQKALLINLIQQMSYLPVEQQPNKPNGHLNFLQPPSSIQIRRTLAHQFNITEEILRTSINQSYIGMISGRNQDIKEDDLEAILPPIEEQPHHKRRINFSQLRDVPTSKIFKETQSRIHEPGKSSGRSSVIPEEPEMEQVELATDSSFLIQGFEGKGNKQLLYNQACLQCSKQLKKHCRLQLLNQSTLQVYLLNSDIFGKTHGEKQLVLALNFDTTTVVLEYAPKLNQHEFSIVAGDIRLLLFHQNAEVLSSYVKQLQRMQKQSKGQQLRLNRILEVPDFHLRRFQTEEFFVENCETGDILLFEDTHFFAKAQRFFTNSDFDHVAVAIKDNNYGLLMFESMSKGVSLTPWRSVIRFGWYEQIPRIVWRRLSVQRDQKFFQTVESFVKENIEKSYHISFAKLTAQQSMIHAPSGVKREQVDGAKNEVQGFFCSELVATLYKDLGLLTRDTTNSNYQPACKFYPKDFSVKGSRKLDRGELSPEYDIYFDNKLLQLNYPNFKFKE